IPSVLLVLLQTPGNDLVLKLIVLVAVQIVAQQIVMQLIAPRVFSTQMGIPPLLLFAALLVGAKAGGIWGAFFAGPVAAVAYATVQVYYERLSRTSALFRASDASDATDATDAASAADNPVLRSSAEPPEGRQREAVGPRASSTGPK